MFSILVNRFKASPDIQSPFKHHFYLNLLNSNTGMKFPSFQPQYSAPSHCIERWNFQLQHHIEKIFANQKITTNFWLSKYIVSAKRTLKKHYSISLSLLYKIQMVYSVQTKQHAKQKRKHSSQKGVRANSQKLQSTLNSFA